ncbi:MAG TPA: NAD(P)-binding protein [Phnomibacter sp.]|nr:NAD(P)-binding protein [Phnomibacter sp.]
MKIAIIGSGISGLSFANLVKDKHEIVLFERSDRSGGLIKCDRVQNVLFHRVGGHVFNAKNKEILDWFWSHFDKENEFVTTRRNARVWFNNQIIGYPIENSIYNLDADTVKKIISELLELAKKEKKNPLSYDNFEHFLKGSFGDTLYEIYFEPYNKKIWRTDLSTVSMEWLEGKLPMPNFIEIITSNVLRLEEEGMVHASFFYPRVNGSQFIADRLSAGLKINYGQEITSILLKNDTIEVGGQSFDNLVYCGDIRRLPCELKYYLRKHDVDVDYLEGLRSNGTSNLLCETDDNDLSWLYIPQPFTMAHRIIYTGNFSETNNKLGGRKTCVVEFSGHVPRAVMEEEIKKLPGHLKGIASNYEPNSYVIQDKRTRNEISKAKIVLKAKGIYLLGRFAEWEYYNMDKAIEAAFALSKNYMSCEN